MRGLIIFLATGGYTGYFPFAPGTVGSLVGVGIYVFLWFLLGEVPPRRIFPVSVYLLSLLALFFLTSWLAAEAERIFEQKDCRKIVIDEIVGYLVTMSFLPPRVEYVILGFICFRFFDILKPYPVGAFERKLGGGYAVVADDVMAGIYANIVLQVLLLFELF
ncbi:MAG: phosphatidylglycerophosphatase A [Deltaproteobacteria bacterium]|nr:MAG: phosphatidylglycerophosphatase A [Deltaproteobacteria bacterium]